ncbi:MAG: class A beta-lactamase [Labilithrix sp.]|nr:class A beta-lactamase [Labilithrix sp.]MCW5814962.1 class A beta-lactamase [Labilithrix sp.]
MLATCTRRRLLAGAVALLASAGCAPAARGGACAPRREPIGRGRAVAAGATMPRRAEEHVASSAIASSAIASGAIAEVERRVGGRVGVFAIDTASGRAIAHRDDERFAMCSTFKWVLAALMLERVDRGALDLGERLAYGDGELLEHSPVTREHVRDGGMSVEALAEAAVTVSDNAAANLLLARLGGPAALTSFARAHGDEVTRLDRTEPSLNENAPGDPRDTTSPRAMAGLMRALLCGEALTTTSRERLLGWLRASTTGKDRLRAGFPADWSAAAGDKTGTGPRGATNDVAIVSPPGRAPILVTAYLSDGHADATALADIGRIAATHFA